MDLQTEKTVIKILKVLLSIGSAIINIAVIVLLFTNSLNGVVGIFLLIGLILIEVAIGEGLKTIGNVIKKSIKVEKTLEEKNLVDDEDEVELEGEQVVLPPEVPYDDEEGNE